MNKNYLVSARKYRPLLFSQVIGQEHITKTLENTIINNRIGHAYLFTGPRGVGKTTTARIFSKALNCINGPTVTPCNKCDSCTQINEGRSFDVLEIDGASNRGIDEIRALKENINYSPSSGKYKIYIIDEVHMLTEQAFNALLKTLEEPPPQVIFILATTEPNKIPITILSRCQRYDFKRVSINEISQQLKNIANNENINIDDASIKLIARAADGSVRDAESIFDQVISFCNNNVKASDVEEILGITGNHFFVKLFSLYFENNLYEALKTIDEYLYSGKDIKEFLNGFSLFLRNLIILKLNETPDNIFGIAEDEKDEIINIAKNFSFIDLFRIMNIFSKYEKIIRYSPNSLIQLEMFIIKLFTINKLEDIENIILKLNNYQDQYTPTQENKKKTFEIKNINNQNKFWPEILDIIKKKDAVLYAHMQESIITDFTNNKLKIKIPYANERTKKIIEKNKFIINETLSSYLNEKIAIEIEYDIIDHNEILEKIEQDKKKIAMLSQNDGNNLHKIYKEYPIIQYAVEKFNGYLIKNNSKKER